MSGIIEKLSRIQRTLNAPKNQYNSFGKYKYRSCEDILEAVKKLLADNEAVILTDEVVQVGERVYVKATAKFYVDDNCIDNSAFAREPENKKGMDDSQITGTASSYARKYALNGLFLIDDNKDADTMDNSLEGNIDLSMIKTIDALTEKYNTLSKPDQNRYKSDFAKRKSQIQG